MQQYFKLKDGENDNLNNDVDAGKSLHPTWLAYALWTTLVSFRIKIEDMLRVQAHQNRKGACTSHQRFLGFLACKYLQDIQFSKSVLDWKKLRLDDSEETGEHRSILMECYNIIVC